MCNAIWRYRAEAVSLMRRGIKGEILGGIQGPWERGAWCCCAVALPFRHNARHVRPEGLLGPAVGRVETLWFGWFDLGRCLLWWIADRRGGPCEPRNMGAEQSHDRRPGVWPRLQSAGLCRHDRHLHEPTAQRAGNRARCRCDWQQIPRRYCAVGSASCAVSAPCQALVEHGRPEQTGSTQVGPDDRHALGEGSKRLDRDPSRWAARTRQCHVQVSSDTVVQTRGPMVARRMDDKNSNDKAEVKEELCCARQQGTLAASRRPLVQNLRPCQGKPSAGGRKRKSQGQNGPSDWQKSITFPVTLLLQERPGQRVTGVDDKLRRSCCKKTVCDGFLGADFHQVQKGQRCAAHR